jgi:16S rRNA (guanine(966)-N(2))-methyltransferase RsmD
MIRIISGKWRGKKIAAPDSLPVRPTTDRAKESLFNWLNFRIEFEGIRVLDLFSGTGNLSYECISRGAGEIHAIDSDQQCVSFINKTFTLLKHPLAKAMRSDLPRGLQALHGEYDLILADPPYNFDKYDELVSAVIQGGLMHEETWFILEHDSNHSFEDYPYFYESRKYGKVNFTFFTKKNLTNE